MLIINILDCLKSLIFFNLFLGKETGTIQKTNFQNNKIFNGFIFSF